MLQVRGRIETVNIKKDDCIEIKLVPYIRTNDDLIELYELKKEAGPLHIAIAREPQFEQFMETVQLDFEIRCPNTDCQSYNCLIGKRIAVCKECDLEFPVNLAERREKSEKELDVPPCNGTCNCPEADPPEEGTLEEPPPEEAPEDMAQLGAKVVTIGKKMKQYAGIVQKQEGDSLEEAPF